MIKPKIFYDSLQQHGVDFFTGVPDSLLKDICSFISDNSPKRKHIIAANEGGAVALATGHYLATKKTPLIYMQNSGFGNTINPLLSLADSKVYGIPMILLVGWRGEPGKKDEPQHIKQGEVSEMLFNVLGIPYVVISAETKNIDKVVSHAVSKAEEKNEPRAILVKKGTFEPYSLKTKTITNFELNREEAIVRVANLLSDSDIVVATTGKASRELFEYRTRNGQGHERDFLTVGGMGHANQIALGISIAKPKRKVYCFDGDGAVIMHTGSLGIISSLRPINFKHIVFNNGSHDSVGGQPTIGFDVDFSLLAKNFNYKNSYKIYKAQEFENVFKEFKNSEGPSLLEILINKGSRNDLGRPTTTPLENKLNFMSFIS